MLTGTVPCTQANAVLGRVELEASAARLAAAQAELEAARAVGAPGGGGGGAPRARPPPAEEARGAAEAARDAAERARQQTEAEAQVDTHAHPPSGCRLTSHVCEQFQQALIYDFRAHSIILELLQCSNANQTWRSADDGKKADQTPSCA